NVTLGAQTLSIGGASTTFSGVISGTGGFKLLGGTQTLSGANTYTGGTTISGGTLVIGAAGTTGSIVGDIANNGVVQFNRSDAVTFGNTISGAGAVTQYGAGSTTFTTAQTYTGLTTITAGTLALSGNGSIAASSGLSNSGTFDISAASGPVSIKTMSGAGSVVLGANNLVFTNASSAFSGVISGTGGLQLLSGTQALSGANTYTGGTTITAGTLSIGNGSSSGSIVGNVLDNGTLAFNRSDAITFDGIVSGSGALTQIGVGSTTLTGAQTYTGATTITSGTLALSGNGSIAASSGLTDNGTFDISATTAGASITSMAGSGLVNLGTQNLTIVNPMSAFAGRITGTGQLSILAGTQTLSGTSTYTGATTIAGGATIALSGSGSISSSARLTDNGTFDISATTNGASIVSLAGSGDVILGARTLTISNASDTFSGDITGAGGLTVNSGTQTFGGLLNYSGDTSVNTNATMILTGTSGLDSSNLIDNGLFDASGIAGGSLTLRSLSGSGALNLGANTLNLANASGIFSGTIATTGGLILQSGKEIITGALNYTGGTTIAGGTLQIGNGALAGSLTGDVLDNGTLAFYRADNYTFAGNISGSGTVSQIGSGTAILTGTNTYNGGTTISRGTLQIGNGGTTGSIVGDVTDNGTFAFNRSDNVNYGGVISGTGGLSQLGSGSLIISGANTYTGTTLINASGTLVLSGTGSIAASKSVNNNGILDLSSASGGSVNLVSLAGSGSTLLGANNLMLTGGSAITGTYSGVISGTGGLQVLGGTQTLSGTNTYTGATTVSGGTLIVNGSIASSSGVTVGTGGTLSGTGTVGSTTFTSGGTYLVDVSSLTASKLTVNGTASLAGTLLVDSTDGHLPVGQQFTVLSANSITGSFATVTGANSNFSYHVSYDANDVFLLVSLAHLTPMLPTGATRNQLAVTGGIDAAIAAGDTLSFAFENLGNLAPADLASATDQLSGEVGANLSTLGSAAFTPFRDAILDRVSDLSDGKKGRDITDSNIWVSGYGMAGSVAADTTSGTGAHKLTTRGAGAVLGSDWRLSSTFTVGAAASFGTANLKLAGNYGTARADTFQLAAYGYAHYSPHIYGSWIVAAALDDVSTKRAVTVSGGGTMTGSFLAETVGARYETGLYLGWLTPYVAAQTLFFHSPGYGEKASTGSSDFALDYDAHNDNTTRLELGFAEGGTIRFVDDTSLVLSTRLAYAHDIVSAAKTQAAFAALPGSVFTVYGSDPATDFALVSLGATLNTGNGFGINAKVNGAFGSGSQSYDGTLGVSFKW
ncbi:MAG TPA: autotransporter-associated beta strand repeat-containing protein, partial [Rhizomicrobium sp.]|nr:autotransporter-associated beta strand repeat-containing protein [Rhizomicrobium sp.]